MKTDKFYENYFKQIISIAEKLDLKMIKKIINQLKEIRNNNGRVYFLGVGGSAANCSHAVSDFRKLCAINAFAATDNISELTARINDDGWLSVFSNWLNTSNLNSNDGIFIFSVGGGDNKRKVSQNLIEAVNFAKSKKSKIFGIVGRNGGFTKKNGDYVLVIPNTDDKLVTPLSESFQSIVWHCIVSSPELKINKTKW